MAFTDIFIRRPVLAIVVSLLILLAGLRSLQLLTVGQYPKSETAVVYITTMYTGADAELVKGFITTPLEREIASADGIDYIESSSIPGVSSITAHLKLNYPPYDALTQITAKVNRVRADLPADSEEPTLIELADRRGGGGDVPELQSQQDAPGQPDHRLPGSRRAAETGGRRPVFSVMPQFLVGATSRCASGWIRRACTRCSITPRDVHAGARREQLPGGGRQDQGRMRFRST